MRMDNNNVPPHVQVETVGKPEKNLKDKEYVVLFIGQDGNEQYVKVKAITLDQLYFKVAQVKIDKGVTDVKIFKEIQFKLQLV